MILYPLVLVTIVSQLLMVPVGIEPTPLQLWAACSTY